MPPRTATIIIVMVAFFTGILTSCKNAPEVPFPEHTDDYEQPVTIALHFDTPQKLKWPDHPSDLTSEAGKFDFDKLPLIQYDSARFKPFPKPPEEARFDLQSLPDTILNFENFREIPLRFKISVLPSPEIRRVNRPVLKKVNSEVIYDFGDQFNGVNVTALLKTKDGFIWIASSKGMHRFDGENLFLYSINGLRGDDISGIAEDSTGQVWVSTFSRGLFAINLRDGVSKNISSKEGMVSDLSVRVITDHQNHVWATFFSKDFQFPNNISGGSVAIIDQEKKTIRILERAQGLRLGSPSDILEDRRHNIWINSVQNGLSILDFRANRIRYLDKNHGLNTDTLTVVTEDRSGRIWVSGFFGETNVIDFDRGTIKKFGIQQGFERNFTFRIIEDYRGNIWIASDKNVKIIDSSLQFVKTIDQSTGLNAATNKDLLEDNSHQMFVGNDGGLNILSKGGMEIHRAGNSVISTLLADRSGRIWVGTLDKGIQIVDAATGNARLYNQEHGLSNDFIQNIIEYNGQIVLSTQKGGLEFIDSSLKKIERIGAAQGLVTANITGMEKDKNGNLWVAGLNSPGVDVLDIQHKKITHIGLTEGLYDSTIIDIRQDPKGLMWFYSPKNGIGVIDIDAQTVRHIVKSDFKSLTGGFESNVLMHDSHGQVWLMSSNSGLFLINAARDSVTHFTTNQGLLSNQLTSVKEFRGRIYIGTKAGLSILIPPSLKADKKWRIESIGRFDGILKNANTYNSDLLLDNGQYWWGDNGITIINNLEKRISDTIAPNTYITGLDIFNRPQNFYYDPWDKLDEKDTIWNENKKNHSFYLSHKSTGQIDRLNAGGMSWDSLKGPYNLPINLRLPYNKNYLQFHFAQAHLGTQDTVWYRYIFEGLDKKWSEKTSNNFTDNYPNIAPGSYVFKVSSLYRGRWSDPVAYPFTIASPWWKTPWAWLLYAIIVGAMVWSFIQYRSRWLKEENRRLEEMVTQRTNELSRSLTELKEAQAQLIQSEKMASLGELTAGIAHEIQNPLNFVNNFAEVSAELAGELKEEIHKLPLAQEKKNSIENIANDLVQNQEKINFHGKRADSIVKGMLQHSRNSNGQKEPTDINALADEYLRLSYHGLRARDKTFNATMQTDFDQTLGPIIVAPQDFGRAILNLFTNAFYSVTEKKKLLGENGQAGGNHYEPTVSVTTKKIKDKIEIRVRDNGLGIPQRVLDKIFQPFFTTKPSGQGTGLGLSLSYDIITKAHGGSMKALTKEGEYAEFIIQLPV